MGRNKTTQHLADHIRQVYFGGNWTCSNVKDVLKDISWNQATVKVENFNTIVTLVYHIGYYIDAVLKVFDGKPLDSKDELSFNHPPINSEKDWKTLVEKTLNDAELFANKIEQLPDNILWEDFTDKKYKSYFRNIQGIIEHTHYHLGQIVILKKMVSPKP